MQGGGPWCARGIPGGGKTTKQLSVSGGQEALIGVVVRGRPRWLASPGLSVVVESHAPK